VHHKILWRSSSVPRVCWLHHHWDEALQMKMLLMWCESWCGKPNPDFCSAGIKLMVYF
jgi:hypothetical protein